MKRTAYLIGITLIGLVACFWTFSKVSNHTGFSVGQRIDSLNGVYIYYNGSVDNVTGRNTTSDGYNLGLKYQCVEFVKRYYYEHLNHKMPDSYGHAKDFFDPAIADGKKSKKRNLIQYSNPSKTKPKVNDLLIFDGTIYNQYGHVAIISGVTENEIEIIQQNPGPSGSSRANFAIEKKDDKWVVINSSVLGWLRKE
ncbi:MAG: CHAP domain-containing protein [Cyclobacteriaceae bacterium]|nr:CHAP domain-containing protein [Cyclobacteriaceae bacterium]